MQDAHELRCGSVAAAERAYALGYASVALEIICDAAHARDATPLDWGEPRDVETLKMNPRLRLLKRLTVRLDAPPFEPSLFQALEQHISWHDALLRQHTPLELSLIHI